MVLGVLNDQAVAPVIEIIPVALLRSDLARQHQAASACHHLARDNRPVNRDGKIAVEKADHRAGAQEFWHAPIGEQGQDISAVEDARLAQFDLDIFALRLSDHGRETEFQSIGRQAAQRRNQVECAFGDADLAVNADDGRVRRYWF